MQDMKLSKAAVSGEELRTKNIRKLFESAAIELSKNNQAISQNL